MRKHVRKLLPVNVVIVGNDWGVTIDSCIISENVVQHMRNHVGKLLPVSDVIVGNDRGDLKLLSQPGAKPISRPCALKSKL